MIEKKAETHKGSVRQMIRKNRGAKVEVGE